MKSLRRPARLVLWFKANTMAEINIAIKPLSRLNKLELTAFTVGSSTPSDQDASLAVHFDPEQI